MIILRRTFLLFCLGFSALSFSRDYMQNINFAAIAKNCVIASKSNAQYYATSAWGGFKKYVPPFLIVIAAVSAASNIWDDRSEAGDIKKLKGLKKMLSVELEYLAPISQDTVLYFTHERFHNLSYQQAQALKTALSNYNDAVEFYKNSFKVTPAYCVPHECIDNCNQDLAIKTAAATLSFPGDRHNPGSGAREKLVALIDQILAQKEKEKGLLPIEWGIPVTFASMGAALYWLFS